jgi:hypothetical protein
MTNVFNLEKYNELKEVLDTKTDTQDNQDSFKDADELELFQKQLSEKHDTKKLDDIIKNVKNNDDKTEKENEENKTEKDKILFKKIKDTIELFTNQEYRSKIDKSEKLTKGLLKTPFINYLSELKKNDLVKFYSCIENLDYESKKMVYALLVSLETFGNNTVGELNQSILDTSILAVGILASDDDDGQPPIEAEVYKPENLSNNFKDFMGKNKLFEDNYKSLFRKFNRMLIDCNKNSNSTIKLQESEVQDDEVEYEPQLKKQRNMVGGKKSRKNKKGSKKSTKKSKKTTKKQKRSKRKH